MPPDRLFDCPEPWGAELGRNLNAVRIEAPLSSSLAEPVTELVRHFGFAVVSSPPCQLDRSSIGARSEELKQFSAGLGSPIVQSPRRELVEDVKDYSDIDVADPRGYRSGGELLPHSDPPTLLTLHCIQPAKTGGGSSLVNVAAIVNRLEKSDPGLVHELFEDLPNWRVAGQGGIAEEGPGSGQPVLACCDSVLSCVLYRPFIERAADELATPLTGRQRAALDLFERWSLHDDLTLRFVLGPGETLVLHNRSVLHARTDYEDWPEFERRRHLLRTWIDAPDRFRVHPKHELGDFFALGSRPGETI